MVKIFAIQDIVTSYFQDRSRIFFSHLKLVEFDFNIILNSKRYELFLVFHKDNILCLVTLTRTYEFKKIGPS